MTESVRARVHSCFCLYWRWGIRDFCFSLLGKHFHYFTHSDLTWQFANERTFESKSHYSSYNEKCASIFEEDSCFVHFSNHLKQTVLLNILLSYCIQITWFQFSSNPWSILVYTQYSPDPKLNTHVTLRECSWSRKRWKPMAGNTWPETG